MCEIADYSQVVAKTREYILNPPPIKVGFSMLPFSFDKKDGRYDFEIDEKQQKTLTVYRSLLFAYSNYLSQHFGENAKMFDTINIKLSDKGQLFIDNGQFSFDYDGEAVRLFMRDVLRQHLDYKKDLNPVCVKGDKILIDEASNFISMVCTSLEKRIMCVIEFDGDVSTAYNILCATLGPEYMSEIAIYSTDKNQEQNIDVEFNSYFERILVPQKRGTQAKVIYDSIQQLKKA